MSQETQDKVIEAMYQDNVEMKERPANIKKTLVRTLFVGVIVMSVVLSTTGALYWLSFFISKN